MMSRRLAAPLLVLAVAGASAAPGRKDRPTTDPDLVGDWVLKAITQGGVRVSRSLVPDHSEFTTAGERIGRNRNGIIVSTHKYSANRGRTPRTLDVWSADDGSVDARGVYAIDGDKLTVVYVTEEKADRPTKLDAADGSPVFQAVYERRRKD